MKWQRLWFVGFFWLFASAWLWAQSGSPPSSTTIPPGQSTPLLEVKTSSSSQNPSSKPPTDPSSTLGTVSDGLNQTADELEKLFAALNASLQAAGLSQIDLEGTLEQSLESAMSGISSLSASKLSLQEALKSLQAEIRHRRLVNGTWRLLAIAGSFGVVGAISHPEKAQGAMIGVSAGVITGLLWGGMEWLTNRLDSKSGENGP